MPGYAELCKKAGTVIGYAVTNQKNGEDEVEVLLLPGIFHIPKTETYSN